MNQTTTRPARAAAIARQDDGIQKNVQRIEEARQAAPRSALQMMAERLNVPSTVLKSTLMATVFKGAKDDEFVALVIVANEYQLNPLTKEIYAFPAKGGGIVPVISVDGWISIMNRHPMFDGIEFTDIPDEKGNLMAIETIIYRKDRTRPIKVTEYLDECRRSTDPWKQSPARMLRHKSLIQCNRVAFGFSGVYSEDDDILGDVGPSSGLMPMRDITPQRAQEQHRVAIHHDAQTGEIDDDRGQAVDEAQQGPTDDQRGETHTTVDAADEMVAEINQIELVADVDAFMRNTDLSLLDDDQAARVEAAADNRSAVLRKRK